MTKHPYILLCRRYLVENWKRHALLTLILTLFFYLAFAFSGLIGSSFEAYGPSDFDIIPTFGSLTALLMLAFAYHSAHSMPFLSQRTSRIAHYVIPASPCAKYSACVTAGTLYPLLQTLLAALLADTLHALRTGSWALVEFTHAMFWRLLRTTINDIPGTAALVVVTVFLFLAVLVFTNAWYTLSATLFRRHPFLIGFLILAFSRQILSWMLLPLFASMDYTDFANLTTAQQVSHAGILLLSATLVLLAISFAIHCIAYHRSKKIEL